MNVQWHVIYTEGGKVQDYVFEYENNLYAAEAWFVQQHPKATYWEVGLSADQWTVDTLGVRH